MRKLIGLLVVVLAVAGAACDITQTTLVTGPDGSDGSGDAPFPTTPVAGQCNLIEGVRIARFEATCSVGQGNALTAGCQWPVTATPLLAGGNPAPVEIHGTYVDWTGTAGVVEVRKRGDNPFTRTIVVLDTAAPGADWTVTASNCSKVGTLPGTVR